ncbi:glycerol-3-phosphate dehydrogenase subunit GlpB [Parendozoicomonas sp. Alg238-R29]|uniref:glycerol-3-phosphate dehydrogenase subunit GlpB n=1 Tax=Parendozoicomonas sp. Alg238-R29 TaxID=2993446 RepID=UPI00248E34D7|nr:glycerol-3-phosphate dehydrogenase subunit GlpB [Parendozoicomonas sp. Alg238-R29]
MIHECLIVGGGLAGLTAGIRCAEAGLKVAVVSGGESALTFASGSIDVLGSIPGQPVVRRPFDAIDCLAELSPGHPYAKIGREKVFQSLGWFHGQMAEVGLELGLASDCRENQWRITAAGSLRPTWLSQPATKAMPWECFHGDGACLQKVVFVNITGFLDFMPELAMCGLKQHPSFRSVAVEHFNINLPLEHGHGATADTMRAPQLASAMGDRDMDILARVLSERVQDAELVVMPACFDPDLGCNRLQKLRQRTGLNIIDIATLPPSVHGLRLHKALRNRFRALGGFLIPGTEVRHGTVDGDRVMSVSTGEDLLSADHFILASGSFFSKGLQSVKESMSDPCSVQEPVFNLDLHSWADQPKDFSSHQFLAPEGQNFVRSGVALNQSGQPMVAGKGLHNLHVSGAVLGGYDPVQECSGGGVAISTGWQAAENVICQVKGQQV